MTQETSSKQPSPEIKRFVEAIKNGYDIPSNDTLERATPRWEYRKCRKWTDLGFCDRGQCDTGMHYCQGPYLYLYWKENGKLKKKYVGRDSDKLNKKLMKGINEITNSYTSRLEAAGIDLDAKMTAEEFIEKTRGLF